MRTLPAAPLVGYVEGYYGRLPDWTERARLVDALAAVGMSAYWYAPKEDARHRVGWREPYDDAWRARFRAFADHARTRGVALVAGVAPGLDFDFAQLPDGADFRLLVAKTRALLEDGATHAALLLDDIDADFTHRRGRFASEGAAHASLADALGKTLGQALLVVPRIYANELHAEAPAYLPDFAATLDLRHAIVHCGSDVVARRVTLDDCHRHLGRTAHRIVVWDNLYANDYCPRRLFVGPWRGRERIVELFVNPTGLVATDALLIDLVAAERVRSSGVVDGDRVVPVRSAAFAGEEEVRGGEGGGTDAASDGGVDGGDEERARRVPWRAVLDRHGVPAAFDRVASLFDAPCFNAPASTGGEPSLDPPDTTLATRLDALETLTWRWKGALAREWFPYLMGLRHDLLIEAGELPDERVAKTQLAPLARRLLRRRTAAKD